MIHKSVLLNEIVSNLALGKDATIVDGTLGAGGHAKAICEKFPGLNLIGIDADARAIREARKSFIDMPCDAEFALNNFRNIGEVLGEKKVDAIILDLGFSSDQLETSGRGFSFTGDEPLLMTMKENPSPEDLTAENIVNDWSRESLEKIILGFGEERRARRIAKAIVEARSKKAIKTTRELVEIISQAVRQRGKINPATKTFQALRIAVNDELGALEKGMREGFEALAPRGRMLIISFHSLEDRMVKNFFRTMAKEGRAILINKKPITSTDEELRENKRARSAKLRIIEKK